MGALEVFSGGAQVYYAAVATAFANLADDPGAGSWTLLGTVGNKGLSEDGITLRHNQEIVTDPFRFLGSTGPRKAARTREDVELEFVLADLASVAYARALNGASQTVTDTAAGVGAAGNKNFDMQRGLVVDESAYIVKADPGSTELAAGAIQWDIPIAVQVASPEVVMVKGAPGGLRFTLRLLEDATLGFGKVRIEDQEAS